MIYLLEDDDSIRDFVIYTLNSQGMEARGFVTPSSFWEAMAQTVPSLVLLDIMLPEEDGISVLKKLRASGRTQRLRSLCSRPRARNTIRCWDWTRAQMTMWPNPSA